ncbi:unnamed protein product [Dovyalis caffra]|uniref:Uncharacterized protein n=1 Tax=Dovyalis caffra TaxID=77055 RepID=A0AAV1RW21_9ROSI|nr:unnamed protein product [Dovyalis caffra]
MGVDQTLSSGKQSLAALAHNELQRKIDDELNAEKTGNYIVSCKDADGGFGCTPGLSLLEYPGLKAIDPTYASLVDVVHRIFFGR